MLQALEMPERSGLFCSLLGFDRNITVPILQEYVQEQRTGGGGES